MGTVELDSEALDQQLRTWEQERDLSGTVLMTHGGDVVFERHYGYADRATGAPVTERTRFGLASVTKMFTATAVMDLLETDALTLETPVVSVLPAERRPSTLLPEVTVHHLLSHTSGIADYSEEEESYENYLEDYGSLWESRPSYSMERPIDFLPLFGDLPPYRSPDSTFQYSNAGYVLLALVLEEVTGRPFTEVVQVRVFDRAGMADSGFFRLDEPVPDVAVGYLPRASPDEPWRSNIYRIPVIGGGDGGAHSTTRDLDRFLRAYSDGTLLNSQHDLVVSRHADAGDGHYEGYGVHLYPDGRYGHGGWDPGVTAVVNRWPDEDVHIIALTNVEGLATEVRDEVLTAWRG